MSTDHLGSKVEAGRGKRQLPDLLVEVNARVRELADPESRGTEKWDFRCECGDPECRSAVPLTVAEYEAHRSSRRPILADGHEQSRVRATREASRELRDDARALHQQARVQVERARRNLDPDAGRFDLVCGSCGYGISVARLPHRCPMCSAQNWRLSRRPPHS